MRRSKRKMRKNEHYYQLVDKNYSVVYDHFKEQDQLRNTSFGFFTTLSVATLGFIDKNKSDVNVILIFLTMFILGILFSILLCRYKYYGNIYSITMKILRHLSVEGKNVPDEDYINSIIDQKTSRIKKNYLADYIVFLCLSLINCLNLLMFLSLINVELYLSFIILLIYMMVSNYMYLKLVIHKSRKCTASDLSFVDTLYVKNDK